MFNVCRRRPYSYKNRVFRLSLIHILTGDNGILTQAKEAKEANIAGTEKEQIQLAMQSLKMKKQADNVDVYKRQSKCYNV